MKQHIDAIHSFPWKLRARHNVCKKCGERIVEGEMDKHMTIHDEILEITEIIENEYGDEDPGLTTTRIEERDGQTPIPESIFICGECNKGIGSEKDVEIHMKLQFLLTALMNNGLK